jgi:hypothetical protein
MDTNGKPNIEITHLDRQMIVFTLSNVDLSTSGILISGNMFDINC